MGQAGYFEKIRVFEAGPGSLRGISLVPADDPAPGAPLSRGTPAGAGLRGVGPRAARTAAAQYQRLSGRCDRRRPSREAGSSRQRQKWRAYTGGHSEQRPYNGACARANVRQQPRSGFKAVGPVGRARHRGVPLAPTSAGNAAHRPVLERLSLRQLVVKRHAAWLVRKLTRIPSVTASEAGRAQR